MIGQEKLLQKLNSYSLETLPQTILLLGDDGCGKHTVTNLLATRLNLPVITIDTTCTSEALIEYQHDPIYKLYIIDLAKFSEKQQNQFLKFIEEPSKTMHIILLSTSEVGVLATILNRCIKFHFEEYSIDQLKQLKTFSNSLIYQVCKTPGQLISTNENNIVDLYNICKKLPMAIKHANYANMLTLETKINYKDQYDKLDLNTFFNTILYAMYNDYIENNNSDSLKIYTITNNFKQTKINKVILKENFVLNYLTFLWEAFR